MLWAGNAYSADKPADPVALSPVFRDDIEFKAYFVVGEQTFVSLASDGSTGTWRKIGGTYKENEIVRFVEAEHFLILRDPHGEEFALRLAASAIKDSGVSAPPGVVRFSPSLATPAKADDALLYPPKDAPRSKEGLDWDWINSDANPMRYAPVFLRREDKPRWEKFTPQQKAELVEFYRQCGWFITVIGNGGGGNYRKIDGKIGKIEQEHIKAALGIPPKR